MTIKTSEGVVLNPTLSQSLIRRVEFLIEESKHLDKRDQAVIMTMRVVSNILSIGKDASSEGIKKVNKRISVSALKILEKRDFEKFHKSTINEHPEPLRVTWEWLKQQNNERPVAVQEVIQRFLQNPMVAVTHEEDRKLSVGEIASLSPANQRYKQAGIRCVCLTKEPRFYCKFPAEPLSFKEDVLP